MMKLFKSLPLVGACVVGMAMSGAAWAEEQVDDIDDIIDAPAPTRGMVEAFADESVFVASPAEIIRLRKKLQDQTAAAASPVVGNYDADIPTDILDLDATFDLSMTPGESAPRIYIARYQSTAVQIIDVFGNHWPIRKISSFLDGIVTIERAIDGLNVEIDKNGQPVIDTGRGISRSDPQAGGFTVSSLRHGAVGNATIYLENMAQPISVVLVTKPGLFHRDATIRIGAVGPNSRYEQMFERGVEPGSPPSPDLNNALHGVTPAGAERLVMEGANGKAWVKGDHIYMQTDLAIFSPKVVQATHSAGRFRAYKLPKTTRVMGTNPAGKTVSVKLLRSPAADMQEGVFQ